MGKTDRIFDRIKKRKWAVILFAAIGIVLIGVSYIPLERVSSDGTETEYGQILEEKTKKIIETVTGSNTTEVMITFSNTYIPVSVNDAETLYRTEAKKNYYFEMPMPEISGVMIVCTAVNNESDILTIKQAVSTCLDIPKSKIYIIGGKTDNEKNHQRF